MRRLFFLPLIGIAMAVLMSSCLHRGTVIVSEGYGGAPVAVYHYWYYPSLQIYFDSSRRVYYFPENGTWMHASRLPARFVLPKSHVMVDGDRDKPYMEHDKHMKMYPPKMEKMPVKKHSMKKGGKHSKNHKKDMGGDRDH